MISMFVNKLKEYSQIKTHHSCKRIYKCEAVCDFIIEFWVTSLTYSHH
jgi:hypothetical protein